MGDYYTEQLVAKKATATDKLVKAVMVAVTAVSCAAFLIFPFALIVPVILICVCVFVFRSLDVEYEYLYVNGTLDIDKIKAKSKRKRVFSMEMTDLEVIAPAGAPELGQYHGLKAKNYGSGVPGADCYEMIIVKNGETHKIIFEPNEVIIDGMRMLAPRKVVRR